MVSCLSLATGGRVPVKGTATAVPIRSHLLCYCGLPTTNRPVQNWEKFCPVICFDLVQIFVETLYFERGEETFSVNCVTLHIW